MMLPFFISVSQVGAQSITVHRYEAVQLFTGKNSDALKFQISSETDHDLNLSSVTINPTYTHVELETKDAEQNVKTYTAYFASTADRVKRTAPFVHVSNNKLQIKNAPLNESYDFVNLLIRQLAVELPDDFQKQHSQVANMKSAQIRALANNCGKSTAAILNSLADLKSLKKCHFSPNTKALTLDFENKGDLRFITFKLDENGQLENRYIIKLSAGAWNILHTILKETDSARVLSKNLGISE